MRNPSNERVFKVSRLAETEQTRKTDGTPLVFPCISPNTGDLVF
jgi:hypothetical protein